MSEKILIIGAGGYIGSTLCDLLLREGYQVRAVDNFFKGNCDSLLPFVSNSNFEFQFGDITSYEHVEKMIKGVDFIIPMAALVGAPICQKYTTQALSVNVDGIDCLINSLYQKNLSTPIIYTSTGSVYGEVTNGLCTEETEANPLSWYGQTKRQAELILEEYENAIIHRYATACGIGFNSTRVNLLINDIVYQAINNKCLTIFQADFKRTFVHVKDICRAILHTIENFEDMSESIYYNVGNASMNFSKREIVEKIRERTGCHVTYAETGIDLDARNYAVSYDKIYNTGWRPNFDVDYVLDELIKATPIMKQFDRYK